LEFDVDGNGERGGETYFMGAFPFEAERIRGEQLEGERIRMVGDRTTLLGEGEEERIKGEYTTFWTGKSVLSMEGGGAIGRSREGRGRGD